MTSPVVENSAVDALEEALKNRIENPSARMHYRGVGDLLFPGSCCVCGNGTCEQGFVDIGVYFDYEGQVYLCIPCLTEAAETGGMLSIEQSNFIKDLATKVVTENNELRLIMKEMSERLERYESAIGAGVLVPVSPDPDPTVPDSNVTEEQQGEPVDPNGHADDSTDKQDSGESKPDEPVKVQKPKRVSRTPRTNDTGVEL